MSYFIKDGGKAFSDLEGSFEGVTFKPIKEVYSAYLSPIDKTLPSLAGSHSPWFCVKDGRYPLYNITYDSDGYAHTAVKGWNLPIMTCTISSLSGRYYLTGLERNGYYDSYQLPQQHFGYFKKDVLVKDNVGNIKINIGCDHIVNDNGNKLRWTIPLTAFGLYLNDGLTTKHDSISNKTNIFHAAYRKDNFKTLNKSLTAEDGPESYVEANLKNRFDIVNNAPVADTNKFGYQLLLSNDTNFEVSKPPCFRLNVSDIKTTYTGLKITISGYSNFTSSFSTDLTADYMKYYVDTKFIQNGNNLFGSDPYSMHFFYQLTNKDSWDSDGEFSGSVSAKYVSYSHNNNLYTARSFSGNCNYTPICLNSEENAEIQDANTIEFWEHVIPFTIQNYTGDNADTKYYIFPFENQNYITPYSSYYDKQQDKTIELNRFEIDYSTYGLTKNVTLDKTKSWTSISSNFYIWAHQESYNNSFLPFGYTYSNQKQSECKATLTSYSSNYPRGYKKDWCSILTGSNHYTFGRVMMSALIDLNEVDSDETPYLYITLPATTLFLNEEGPTSGTSDVVLSSTHKGLLYQLEMTYEGTK